MDPKTLSHFIMRRMRVGFVTNSSHLSMRRMGVGVVRTKKKKMSNASRFMFDFQWHHLTVEL